MPLKGWKTLTVSDETWNKLGELGDSQHRSRNMVLLQLVEKEFKKYESKQKEKSV